MSTAFIILTIISFVIPFFLWTGIRFIERNNQTIYGWSRKAIGTSFAVCIPLVILFICLAIFLV